MAKRITKNMLQGEVDRINRLSGADMVLDYAACYGGYCLETSLGSVRYTQRMPAREMLSVLQGMLLILDFKTRGVIK